MKISAKGRYALRLMIDLAEHDSGDWISLKDISKRQDISVKYLEQIVTLLSRAGFLKSARGPQGGYMLARNPEEYTSGEILRVVEGELVPVACMEDSPNQCPRYDECCTIGFWEGLYQVINEYVDAVTLEDLMDSRAKNSGWDFSI